LNTPQTAAPKNGVSVTSRVIYPPKQVKINEHVWIDGLHMASEVPNYFTRYLATIKDKIAVLVTLSAHKNFYTKYSQDFFKAVMSLRVIATNNLLAKPEMGPIRPGSETLGQPIGSAMPGEMTGIEPMPQADGGGTGKTKTMLLALAVVLAAVAGYVFMKMRK
jgi:hypothetical protein